MAQQAPAGGAVAGVHFAPGQAPLPVPTPFQAKFVTKFTDASTDPTGGNPSALMAPFLHNINRENN